MNKKKLIAMVLSGMILLTGCSSSKNYNSSAENAVEGFIKGIQNYDYSVYSASVTEDLLSNSSIVLDAEANPDAITIYGQPIEASEFNEMYKSLLGGLIVDFKLGEIKESEYKTVSEEDAANVSDDSENKNVESEETNEDKTKEITADKKETYYKVYGILTIPSADLIEKKGEAIFSKYVESVFAEKTTSKEKAKQAMIKFFTDSFKDLYKTVGNKDVDVCFYVIKDSNGKYKVNDTDAFISMFEAYESANNAVTNSGMYSNDNAYDTYLKLYLSDTEYKTYRETGKLPETSVDTSSDTYDSSTDESDDSGNSTSWKNNQNKAE